MLSNEPFPEHRCDENCHRFCEACNVGICTNDSDDGFKIIAGMIFCSTCAFKGIDSDVSSVNNGV